MIDRSNRQLVLATVTVCLAPAGCNLVLGLDQYTDVSTTGTGGTGGAHSTSTTGSGGATTGTGGAGGGMVCNPDDPPVSCPYSGVPATTEGVGNCKAGMKSCLPDGTGYDTCTGEVTPTAEDCDTLGDEDCNGNACSDPTWNMGGNIFGDAGDQQATSMAVDKDGNILIAGVFQGTLQIGNTKLDSLGGKDYFLVKLDPSGKPIWARRYGSIEDNGNAINVTTDGIGNVILAGEVKGVLDFGACGTAGQVGQQNRNIFIAKLNNQGSCQWRKNFGSATGSGQSVSNITVDKQNNVALTGNFDGTLKFGSPADANIPTLTVKDAGYVDIYVAKLSGVDGSHIWSKSFISSNSQTSHAVYSIAADSANNFYITGFFRNGLSFDQTILTNNSAYQIFFAKLDANGDSAWAKQFGGTANAMFSSGQAIAIDSTDRVLLTGYIGGNGSTIDFGDGNPLTVHGGFDGFVAAFDSDGNNQWSKSFGDPNDATGYPDMGSTIAVDKNKNVIIAGIMYGQADFGGKTLNCQGGSDVFIAKLDPAGQHLWSKIFGDVNYQYANGIGTDPSTGEVIFAGSSQGQIDFGLGQLTSAGGYDIVVAKFQP